MIGSVIQNSTDMYIYQLLGPTGLEREQCQYFNWTPIENGHLCVCVCVLEGGGIHLHKGASASVTYDPYSTMVN